MTTFLHIAALLVFCIGPWFTTNIENALFEIRLAGILQPGWFAKSAGGGVLMAAFAIAVAPTDVGPLLSIVMLACSGSFTAALYVWTQGMLHGTSQTVARQMRHQYPIVDAAAPLARLDDEVALQRYLDATYGRGRVSAKEALARKAALVEKTKLAVAAN